MMVSSHVGLDRMLAAVVLAGALLAAAFIYSASTASESRAEPLCGPALCTYVVLEHDLKQPLGDGRYAIRRAEIVVAASASSAKGALGGCAAGEACKGLRRETIQTGQPTALYTHMDPTPPG